MSLTRERKILVGSVGLALLALVVDRVMLGGDDGPASAHASVVSSVAHSTSTSATGARRASSAEAAVVPDASAGPSLAQRLQTIAQTQNLADQAKEADIFAMPAAWTPVVVEEEEPAEATDDLAAMFKERHQLEAVLLSGGATCAIINGRPVKVGQSIGGFRLVSLEQRSATFHGPSGRVDLTIETRR